jgi:hypothetical protein
MHAIKVLSKKRNIMIFIIMTLSITIKNATLRIMALDSVNVEFCLC